MRTHALLLSLLLAGCAAHTPVPVSAASARGGSPLAGTSWRLVELRSNDDSIGILRPEDPSKYTLVLEPDGTARMRLDCNRGNGSWSATPGSENDRGHFTFGPIAVTRMLCPPPSMGDRVARDTEYVRSYVLADGRLHLNLMADAGDYVWEPAEGSGSP